MITLGFCNLKGGVGKTTACQNIAVALAKAGRKVAVIDMDPQSNLSAGFGVTPATTDPQVFDLLTDETKWDDIVKHKEGVDIIPSSLNLVMAELNQTGLFENDLLLREALKQISPDRYDYVFIDSPPQLGIFTRNVLAACDKIIVPMDGGFYSLFGLKLLENSLSVLRDRLENNLEIIGILMTNYNPRLSISHTIFDEVKKSFGDILFESYISQSVGLIEASSMGLSIFEYSPKSKAAQCYKEVAEELIKRLEGKKETVEIKVEKRKKGRPPKKSGEKVSDTKGNISEEPVKEQGSETISSKIIDRIENKAEKVITSDSNPTQAPDPAPAPVGGNDDDIDIMEIPKPNPAPKVEIESPVKNPEPPKTTLEPEIPVHSGGGYEQGIKQDLIDMLPERQKQIWTQILAPISDVSRGEIDIKELRDDFLNSDKYRYTFYILTDDNDKLDAVSFPDQIVEPLRCVVKLDENGSAEIFF
ncbi:MAG: ParA family protein [Synergistaceae bacterium]|nr:ParA family protein [Synergistaceae bacterium]